MRSAIEFFKLSSAGAGLRKIATRLNEDLRPDARRSARGGAGTLLVRVRNAACGALCLPFCCSRSAVRAMGAARALAAVAQASVHGVAQLGACLCGERVGLAQHGAG